MKVVFAHVFITIVLHQILSTQLAIAGPDSKKSRPKTGSSFPAEISSDEIYRFLTDEKFFKITSLSGGAYGSTRLSTRYFRKSEKTGSHRLISKKSYMVEVATDEKYVIKEEKRTAVMARLLGKRDSFQHEAGIYRLLKNSPLVAEFVTSGVKSNGIQYLITRYGGKDLFTLLAERLIRVHPDTEKHFHRFLFKAQTELMDHNVSYLDWKPENIVADLSGGSVTYRLIDFGLSEITDSEYSTAYSGTPGTAAPELISYSAKSYLVSPANSYAMGATAVNFHRFFDRKFVEYSKKILGKGGKVCPKGYKAYSAEMQKTTGVPGYIMDLIHPDPGQRLRYDPVEKDWYKTSLILSENKYTVMYFDPEELKYYHEIEISRPQKWWGGENQ